MNVSYDDHDGPVDEGCRNGGSWVAGIALSLLIAGNLLLLAFQDYSLLSAFRQRHIRDRLASPGRVSWRTSDALMLADGRTVRLPEVATLPPPSSTILLEVTRRGVEVAPDGRVFALVPIYHSCGNDPVRDHLARVDLSRMLLFLGEAAPAKPFGDLVQEFRRATCQEPEFGPRGWRVGQYFAYRTLNEGIDRGEIPLFAESAPRAGRLSEIRHPESSP